MTERIKLIWDFRGPNAEPIATHHAKHLGEFAATENLQHSLTGVEKLSELHHIAYLVVEKEFMNSLRETLKPHRGQVYTDV
ncbi:hypothetical protein ATE92_0189 [Ulvibacter sp. MAR_2010_11]|uniref:hypothetical protein n=1 Tax=Ulvibacter sp. MAR_2010_11 TaxID=1250229 RepID=UPI000C2BF6A7|nr:hypothetical protein [Ulvibacter sp. MAR_2010_11]PKA82064.1 hypothetical protein ATE92_0189 [Ulvibacter sp. MAR_2010_11]